MHHFELSEFKGHLYKFDSFLVEHCACVIVSAANHRDFCIVIPAYEFYGGHEKLNDNIRIVYIHEDVIRGAAANFFEEGVF